jgi:N-glycosylase/DNA lyase
MKISELFFIEKILDVPTKSATDIAREHGVSVSHIERQLKIGVKVEQEHTSNKSVAREIALDHLGEDPNYYSKLSRAKL